MADAKEKAAGNGIENAVFFVGKAEEVRERIPDGDRAGRHPDVVVVDPPRKGCDEECLRAILDAAPKRVVYVSCDPATLARDVKRFAPLGYAPVRAEAVDLFPRTAHVESVLLLVPCGAAG